jgi:lambda repressor-like predicted transcriptional regulator
MHMDIFKDDAFSLSTLTAAVQDLPYQPGRIGKLGLFGEDSINTLTVTIEQRDDVLELIDVTPRGAPSSPIAHASRAIRSFAVPHIALPDYLSADQITGIRVFGTESEVETMARVVAQRMQPMCNSIEYTIESHRLAAIMGQYMNAGGALTSLFTEFGVSQQTLSFALTTSTTKVRQKILSMLEMIEDALGGLSFTGVRVLCGKTFWAELIEHPVVKETYTASLQADAVRGDPRMEFEFGGVIFERYRGTSAVKVGDDDAYAVPEGVQNLFITRFAPGDFIGAAGTLGQRLYARQWERTDGRGIELECQSNPLNLCTRPRAVIKLTKA